MRPRELRRVVVTGLGVVSPLGVGKSKFWSRLLNGDVAVRSLVDDPSPGIGSFQSLPATIAATVPRGQRPEEFNADAVALQDEKKLASFSLFALAAAQEAFQDAQWKPSTEEERLRTGVCFGSGIGSLDDISSTAKIFSENGFRKVSPFFVPRFLVNMAAGHISMRFGLMGPNHSAATACTTGAHSIGDAARMIALGDADAMVAGSAESCVTPLAIAGFSRAQALTTKYNASPEKASRPFDVNRSGFVLGEGSAAFILESADHAVKRGARIYAELLGYGLSGDAHHITAPPEDGRGALNAMMRALADAGVSPSQVDYVNAHATSTPLGDAAENTALIRVFSAERGNSLSVSSIKGSIGHLLGAAGSVEAAATVLSISENYLPPTANLDQLSDGFPFDYVPKVGKPKQVNIALSNSFGFGGTNASLCFGKFR